MPKHDTLRVNTFLVFILLFASLVSYRLFDLSVVKHAHYSRTAHAQSESIVNVFARGNLYFTDREQTQSLVATNKKFALAHIIPSQIPQGDRTIVAAKLSTLLGLKEEEIKDRLAANSSGTKVIKRKLSNEEIESIKGLGIKGVGVSYETDRYYPAGGLGADVLGFMGYSDDGQKAGQYGAEAFYDADLFGKKKTKEDLASIGSPLSFMGKITALIPGKKEAKKEEKEGFASPSDIALTIDKNIQTFIENKLKDLHDKWQYEKATIIIQEPTTGKILAMADRPSFDPNLYAQAETSLFLNSSVQEIFEPGSSFKPITMAIGLDLGKITPQATYEDKGFVKIAEYEIKNFDQKSHGVNTMAQVLEHSLNTGTMFVQELVGNDDFLNYLINFGFGQRTDIDLPGELSGDITNLYSGRKINFLTASFGQGIAVTPIQLANAYSTIANGGRLMRPYIVEKIIRENGQEQKTAPELISIPITEQTSSKLKSMLVSVVDNGYDKRAKVEGYEVAGKTGTAQIANGTGAYLEGQFVHTFAGFAPAYSARFTILIKMDKPKGTTFASNSLSATFKEITDYLLKYYNIPPTRQ